MAGKFIELKAAAAQLGITTEQLQELREAGKVHGYKDGASWKFKPEEIARLSSEMAASSAAADADELDFDDSGSLSGDEFDRLLSIDAESDSDSEDNLEDSSVLISADAKPGSEQESSSTVIGKEQADQLGSDLRLAEEDEGGSDIRLAGSSAKSGSDADDLRLADSEDLSDELSLADNLDFESDSALMLGDDAELSSSSGSSEQHVLVDSDSSVVDASGSGIGLVNASDSGLSLESGSSAALELPEDEDMISLEDDIALSDDGRQLQQDEEFLLSPSDEMMGDESSDSGSQVIALDDSGAFDSDADVLVADGAEPMLVPEDAEGLGLPLEPIEEAVAVAKAAPGISGAQAPEAAYSVWNLMSLVFVVLLLGVTGMLMADVVRNMWSWNSETGVSSGLANAIIEALGMK